MKLLLLPLVLLVVSCAIKPNPNSPTAQVPVRPRDNSPEYLAAELFDKYASGKITPQEVEAQIARCKPKEKRDDLFCVAWLNTRALDKGIKEKNRIPRAPEKKPVETVLVDYANGKVKGWPKVRKAPVVSLLKGLNGTSLATLLDLSKFVLKERRCPNNLAIAVAATLEDYLPDRIGTDTISQLYEKASGCFRRRSTDRDNFTTRAALFRVHRKEFKEAARLLAKVEPSDAFSGRSLYWLYRSKKELGDEAGATAALNRLQKRHPFSFHAAVASAGTNLDLAEKYLSPESVSMKRSMKSRNINRIVESAEILSKYGFESSAALLANWGIDTNPRVEPGVKVYLAELGDPELKVSVVADLILRRPQYLRKETLELAYPKAFFPYFQKQQTRIDPFLLLAVARKESGFDPKAISTANAQGLLQLLPETAQKLTNHSFNLLDPQDNVALGAQYLSELIHKNNGQLSLAIASYNAGENPVAVWVRRYLTYDPILFIDLIPYRETRDYVGFVLNNYYWYHRIHGADAAEAQASLKQVLPFDVAKK